MPLVAARGADHKHLSEEVPVAHVAHNTPVDSAQDFPLPDYRLMFRLHTWLTNTMMEWPWDLSHAPVILCDLDDALSAVVELACAREGRTYGEMLRAIHAGEFDHD